jgi:predicted secreted protein
MGSKQLDKAAVDAMSINKADLQTEFVTHSGHHGHYRFQLALAVEAVRVAEIEVEHLEATLFTEYEGQDSKAGPQTISRRVKADGRWLALQKRVAGFKAHRDELEAVVEALKVKKDMLVSLGAHLRAEGDPQVNDTPVSRRKGSL